MYSDMLCSVVTETAHAHVQKLVHELHIILLEKRVLRIYVRQTSNALVQDSVTEMNELAGWAWVGGDTSAADLDAQDIQLADMSPEDLLDAAQTILKPGNLTISVKRDPAIVPGDLAPLLTSLRNVL